MEKEEDVLCSLTTWQEFIAILDKTDLIVVGKSYMNKLNNCFTSFRAKDYKESIVFCDMLLFITWEKLNTGHWKDINISWRYLYSLLCAIKSFCYFHLSSTEKNEDKFLEITRICDMGLLMGIRILNNLLSRMVAYFKKNMRNETQYGAETQSHNEPPPKVPRVDTFSNSEYCEDDFKFQVKRCSLPSLEYFRTMFMDKCEPVIIEGSMTHWPAMGERAWTLEYIETVAGHRTVPIEIGSSYTEDEWSQKLMRISEFLDRYIKHPTEAKGYLAQHQLFDQIPELERDIFVPTYCCLSELEEDVDTNAWFGPKGTVSPLHYDPKHNFLCQVVGEKYIKLYAESDSKNVYPHESKMLHNTSRVDVENPDLDRYPLFANAQALECVLKPGDMLYIPPRYWHFVRSLSISFSVSFWW